MRYDLVSFGDITIDNFIRLKDAKVHCNINNENCELCVKFGQKVPFESMQEVFAVGNGPNAAVAAVRLGLQATVVANVGNDQKGEECIATLAKEGMSIEYIRKHDGIKTNYHFVLMYEAERTILVKHEAYPYALPQFEAPPQWFYLTSLPEGTLKYQLDIVRYARENGVKLAFQPGTFQAMLGKEKLKDVYAASEIFFCNKEEAQQILGTQEGDYVKLMEGIRALGPKIVCVTDGPKGSNILDEHGAFHVPMYPDPAPPQNRTGAGDATASTTVSYIIKGLAPKDALLRGITNAAAVVQKIGAQTGLLAEKELDEWYAKRPADFVATPL